MKPKTVGLHLEVVKKIQKKTYSKPSERRALREQCTKPATVNAKLSKLIYLEVALDRDVY